jgi:uncharacterized protein YeaO (DUF488 family)
MKRTIDIQRVYEHAGDDRHVYFLVDQLWPRGIKKDAVKRDGWLKEVAPSNELRDWFSHDCSVRTNSADATNTNWMSVCQLANRFWTSQGKSP